LATILRRLEVELVDGIVGGAWGAEVTGELIPEWAEVPAAVVVCPPVETFLAEGAVSTGVTGVASSCAVSAELAVIPLA